MSRANSRVMMYQQQHARQEKELAAKREAEAKAAALKAASESVVQAIPDAQCVLVNQGEEAAPLDSEGLGWLKTQISVNGSLENWSKKDILTAAAKLSGIELSGWRLSKLIKSELIALIQKELENGK